MLLSWNITQHLITHMWQHPHIRTLAYICMICTATSACVLTVVAAIMHGFEHHTHQQLQSIHPHISVTAKKPHIDFERIQAILAQVHGVEYTSAYAHNYAIISHKEDSRLHAVRCCAIDPLRESATTRLPHMIQTPDTASLEQILEAPGILIAKPLARKLGVHIGDTVYLGYHQEANNDITHMGVIIHGIYATGIEEQDLYLVYMSHETYEDLWENCPVTQIGIRCFEQQEDSLAKSLSELLPDMHVRVWKSAYPALMAALSLEKYAMIAVFSLIVILASISGISLMYLVLQTKSRDCAILYIMGMPINRVQWYFMLISFLFTSIASIAGIACGAIISWCIDTYQLIPLPDVYYLKHVPAHISWNLIASITGITLCINAIAAWIPSRFLKRLDIPRILKGHV